MIGERLAGRLVVGKEFFPLYRRIENSIPFKQFHFQLCKQLDDRVYWYLKSHLYWQLRGL